MTDKREWEKVLGGALEKARAEREAYRQRMSELEAHKEAMGAIGPWDAWGGRLCAWKGPMGVWLKDIETGSFLMNMGEYRRWRLDSGYGWGKTEEVALEWSYLIGGGAASWDRRVWAVEDGGSMLIWDMRTGCWLVDEDTSNDEQ